MTQKTLPIPENVTMTNITRFTDSSFCGLVKGYDRTKLRRDLGAGITVAVVLIPQAMAYAMLAGLRPSMALCCGGGSSHCFMWGACSSFHRAHRILSLLV